MSGLDDARMHRADRDLVQAVAFGRQEAVGRRLRQRVDAVSQREPHTPAIVIEPGPRIGRAFGRQSEQVVDGALQPQCRRVMPADGRKGPVGAIQADDRDLRGLSIHDRHMHRCGFAPKAEQVPATMRQFGRGEFPDRSIDYNAWPRAVLPDLAAFQRQIDQRWHVTSFLSKQLGHMLKPDHQRSGKIDPRAQDQCEMSEHRNVGSLGRRRAAARLAEGDTGQAQHQGAEGQQ